MFPKTGKVFPNVDYPSEAEYISELSRALKAELGATRVATKTIMRWTGASDRTARNWLHGDVGPSGHHLIRLGRASDAVFDTVLRLSNRAEGRLLYDLHAVEVALARASGAFETLRRQRR